MATRAPNLFGRATANDTLTAYKPTMAERIPMAVQDVLMKFGLDKFKARSFGAPVADVLSYSPVGAVAQSWDAGQAAARRPSMLGKAGALGGGMALAALGAVPGGKGLARKGEALAMDEASRMARAAEQGFTRKAYHATRDDFAEFIPSKEGASGPGVYLSKDAMKAGDYVLPNRTRNGRTEGENIMPLLAQKGPYATQSQYFKEVGALTKGGMEYWEARKAASDALAGRGFKGIAFGDNLAVFDPANIRSKFAAFDPAKRGSANLLAGIGAGAMVAPALFSKNREP